MSQGQDTRKTTWSRSFHVGKFHENSQKKLNRATRWTDDEKHLGLGTRRNRTYSIHPVLGLFLLIELKSNLSFL